MAHPQAAADAAGPPGYRAHPHDESAWLPRQRRAGPVRIGTIPPAAQWLQRRLVEQQMQPPSPISGANAYVLKGMGGVGKTQLAACYARDAWTAGHVDLLLWINAGDPVGIETAYTQAAVRLLGPGSVGNQPVDALLTWLEPTTRPQPWRWLIILDDVVHPDHLQGLWPPSSPHGLTLITTRRQDAALAGEGRQLIDVGMFDEREALAYLNQALAVHRRSEAAHELTALAGSLGHLPLALSQAAAYLVDSGSTVATYSRMLHDGPLDDITPDALPDSQTDAVAVTWALSISKANDLRPHRLARPMLQLTSVLDPNGIPAAVLTSPPALRYLAQQRPDRKRHRRTRHLDISEEEATGALRALYRLSLVNHRTDDPHHSVRVHQLVQHAVRDRLQQARKDQLIHTTADALLAAWPDPERDTALAQVLRANAAALIDYAGTALCRPEVHPLLFRIGRSLGKTGQVSAARDYFQSLTARLLDQHGPEHPATLAARAGHARWSGEAGDVRGAAALTAHLVADLGRVLGADDERTLTARSNLARWRGETGDPLGAARATAELLADRIRLQGPDHAQTLSTRSNLAYWQGRAGDVTTAAKDTEELLADLQRILGADHPHTLTARSHLAHLRGQADDPRAALTATAELLEDRERVLGADHPDTLSTRQALAYWHGQAGAPGEAAAALHILLKDQARVMGEDHPRTLALRNNLACWRHTAGDRFSAQQMITQLVPDMQRALGPDHPYTVTAQNNWQRWQARTDAAGLLIPH
ncbi:tetratricopeptide repeat protein [Streptomyces sp. NPDC005141]